MNTKKSLFRSIAFVTLLTFTFSNTSFISGSVSGQIPFVSSPANPTDSLTRGRAALSSPGVRSELRQLVGLPDDLTAERALFQRSELRLHADSPQAFINGYGLLANRRFRTWDGKILLIGHGASEAANPAGGEYIPNAIAGDPIDQFDVRSVTFRHALETGVNKIYIRFSADEWLIHGGAILSSLVASSEFSGLIFVEVEGKNFAEKTKHPWKEWDDLTAQLRRSRSGVPVKTSSHDPRLGEFTGFVIEMPQVPAVQSSRSELRSPKAKLEVTSLTPRSGSIAFSEKDADKFYNLGSILVPTTPLKVAHISEDQAGTPTQVEFIFIPESGWKYGKRLDVNLETGRIVLHDGDGNYRVFKTSEKSDSFYQALYAMLGKFKGESGNTSDALIDRAIEQMKAIFQKREKALGAIFEWPMRALTREEFNSFLDALKTEIIPYYTDEYDNPLISADKDKITLKKKNGIYNITIVIKWVSKGVLEVVSDLQFASFDGSENGARRQTKLVIDGKRSSDGNEINSPVGFEVQFQADVGFRFASSNEVAQKSLDERFGNALSNTSRSELRAELSSSARGLLKILVAGWEALRSRTPSDLSAFGGKYGIPSGDYLLTWKGKVEAVTDLMTSEGSLEIATSDIPIEARAIKMIGEHDARAALAQFFIDQVKSIRSDSVRFPDIGSQVEELHRRIGSDQAIDAAMKTLREHYKWSFENPISPEVQPLRRTLFYSQYEILLLLSNVRRGKFKVIDEQAITYMTTVMNEELLNEAIRVEHWDQVRQAISGYSFEDKYKALVQFHEHVSKMVRSSPDVPKVEFIGLDESPRSELRSDSHEARGAGAKRLHQTSGVRDARVPTVGEFVEPDNFDATSKPQLVAATFSRSRGLTTFDEQGGKTTIALGRSELRNAALIASVQTNLDQLITRASSAKPAQGSDQLKSLVIEKFGLGAVDLAKTKTGIYITNEVLISAENDAPLAPVLEQIAELIDTPIVVHTNDESARMVVESVNRILAQKGFAKERLITAVNTREEAVRFFKEFSYVRVIASDSEREAKSLLEQISDHILFIRKGDVRALLSAFGIAEALANEFRSELCIAISA